MEEYLKKVEEQIRCKKARAFIRQELQDHIEDQMEENLHNGMDKEEAMQAAVREMGDPIETGISLDHVHRPKIAVGLLVLISLISLVGWLLHSGIASGDVETNAYMSGKYPWYVLLGLVVMFLFYFIDYTTIARYAKVLAALLILLTASTRFVGISINGKSAWIYVGGTVISMEALILLYVPIYGGILYHYRKTGYGGVLKAILWMVIPVLAVTRLPSLITAGILMVCMIALLTITIYKNWFTVSKGKTIAVIWSVFLILPVATVAVQYFGNRLALYQKERIRDYLTGHGTANYEMGFSSGYILKYVSATYGIIAGIGICCILGILLVKIFSIAARQKNQLGFLMGCAVGMVYLTNILLNVLINTGILPPATTTLPFFSSGGSNLVVCYALLGIVLDIYRYKDIYPDSRSVADFKRKNRIKFCSFL